MFAEAAEKATWADILTSTIGTIGLVAIAVTAVANMVLQIMAQRAATRAEGKVEAVKVALEKSNKATTTKLDAQAVAVVNVKTALVASNIDTAAKLDETLTTLGIVHGLVNSSMSAQLRISAVALRRVADLTNHPDDVAAAELAERLYQEQEAKQRGVDSARERERS